MIKTKEQYYFCAVKKESEVVGLLAYWDLGTFYFVEHLAIDENLRGQGIGTKVIEKLMSLCNVIKKEDKDNICIVLEVDKPENEENAERRIQFYQRLGFKINYFDYIQPPYGKNKEPVQLYLMTYPNKISGIEEFNNIRDKIYSIVYSD